MFLTPLDYRSVIQVADLYTITEGSDKIREDAELAALEEMQSYLSRFDLEKIFIDVPTWNDTTPFETGDEVYHKDDNDNEFTWIALQDSAGEEPIDPTVFWKKGDLRNKLVIRMLVDLTVYQLYCSIPSRQVPDIRMDRYDSAIKWLEKVATGKMRPPGLPLLENEETMPFRIGSNGKLKNDW